MMMMTLVKVFAANRVCFLASRTQRAAVVQKISVCLPAV